MKYIDAEKLKAEIERLKQDNETSDDKEYAQYEIDVACGYAMACEEILSIIASLQQEQPEVDLEKEIHRFFEDCIEVHEVPLYGKVKERVISVDCYEITAYHFYSLGLNARKDE